MTEQEWLSSSDPATMLAWVRSLNVDTGNRTAQCEARRRLSDRKLWLWSVALILSNRKRYRGTWWRGPDGFDIDLEAEERSLGIDVVKLANDWCDVSQDKEGDLPMVTRATLLRDVAGNPFRPVAFREGGLDVEWDAAKGESVRFVGRGEGERIQAVPHWITPQALTLARAAYEERGRGRSGMVETEMGPEYRSERVEDGTLDPFRLALLADALEEAGAEGEPVVHETPEYEPCAGCNGHGTDLSTGRYPEDCRPCFHCGGTGDSYRIVRATTRTTHPIIEHLRSPGPHVRGCWCLDLLLGKE